VSAEASKTVRNPFSQAYPNIAHWVKAQGWIEIGQDEYSSSLVRALDEGGMVWESGDDHRNVDEALQALETELAEWLKRYG
jgi:hypothetical protein